jgi:hypothetical protein
VAGLQPALAARESRIPASGGFLTVSQPETVVSDNNYSVGRDSPVPRHAALLLTEGM